MRAAGPQAGQSSFGGGTGGAKGTVAGAGQDHHVVSGVLGLQEAEQV